MKCPSCNKAIPKTSSFCAYCGADLQSAVVSKPTPTPTAPPTPIPRRRKEPSRITSIVFIVLLGVGTIYLINALGNVGRGRGEEQSTAATPSRIPTRVVAANEGEGATEKPPSVITEGRIEYVVQPGDTLEMVSEMFGVDVDEVVQANQISSSNALVAGKVLIIPVGSSALKLYTPTLQTTLTPTRRPTSPPMTPWIFDIGVPSITIRIVDDSPTLTSPNLGRLKVTVLGGGLPLRDVNFWISTATNDIAGQWSIVERYDFVGSNCEDPSLWHGCPCPVCGTGSNGSFTTYLDPGTYILEDDDMYLTDTVLRGNWAVWSPYDEYSNIMIVPFPIKTGFTTNVVIELAKLEVGLMSAEGTALKGKLVEIYCQSADIAGSKIQNDTCPEENYLKTDTRGLATFYLGAGTYMVSVYNFPKEDAYFYDITLEPGEVRREILTIP